MKTRDPKKQFPNTNVPEVALKPDYRVTEIRRYKLITPLFGGGVEAHKADPITVIRGASVRGQLRFWWRATRGGQFNGSLEKMREAEQAIWGSAAKKGDEKSGPSAVIVDVRILNRGKPLRAEDRKGNPLRNIGEPNSIYSYVAFPLRDSSEAVVLQDVEFELTVRYPVEVQNEVQAALWAWESFGGLGARTRRGFGAVQLTHINNKEVQLPNSSRIQEHINNGLKQHFVTGAWYRGIPHLAPNSIVSVPASKSSNPQQTWRFLFDKMKEFRQSRYPDRNNRPYGRRKWPEPDTIRRLTRDHSPAHQPRHPVDGKFPRAQFGLPIIFKFKDEDERNGDPSASTLKPKGSERWASPLILRPVVCSDGYIGLAIRLASRLDDVDGGVVLENGVNNYKAEWKLDGKDANQIEPLSGKTDVLQAFLEYLKK
jgi:CRISPR-associated protein Cmr1